METIIQNEIESKGANRFLVESLLQFVFFLVLLLVWVKYMHKQSITSLTTSRIKIDWKRIMFSFSIWAIVTIAISFIGIYLSPDDYEFNFNLKPFLTLLIISILLIPLLSS